MRCVTAVLTCAALLTTGCSGPRQGEDAAPTVARVVCEAGGARAVTPVVRAVEDGINLLFDNRSGARAFYIRMADSPDRNHGGRLEHLGTTDMRTTMPPGEILIGCFERGADVQFYDVTPEFTSVTIVDPHDLWIPPDLPCGPRFDERRFEGPPTERYIPRNPERIVRETVPRVRPDDEIIKPGYPETQWKLTYHQVVRDGAAIAGVMVVPEDGRWTVVVRACPEAAIA